MVTTNNLYIKLGGWKKIIALDLKLALFHNHMHPDAYPHLGIKMPFGGLQLLASSGQGITGQSEELDELLAKILKDELTVGIATKMQDDLIIGDN